jgi:MFS transporter, ACS family, allantoate permease
MCGASIGSIIGQAFDFGAAHIKGTFRDSPWKWIYLLLGSMTVVYSIFFGIFFPDSPMKARYLTERERNIAVRRLKTNQTGIQTRQFKPRQVLAALTDPQLWLLCVTGFAFAFATAGLGRYEP